MTNDVNEFLAGFGVKSAKFAKVGATVSGIIAGAELRDQTDMDTQEVLVWPDGNPRKQLVITLQTEESEDDDDDGRRRIFAKGGMLYAIQQAVGRQRLLIGGKLAVRYTGDGTATKKGFNPPKQYKARYAAPEPGVEVPSEEPPYESYDDTEAPDMDDLPF